jgi:SAM-dependent methyltransferase
MGTPRRRVVDGLRRRLFGAPRRAGTRGGLDLQTRMAAHRHRSFDAMSAVLAWMLQLARSEAPAFELDGRSALEIGTGKFLAQALALHVCGCREVVSVDRYRQLRPEAVREAMSHPVLARRFLSPFVGHDAFLERLRRLQASGYDLDRLRALGIDYRAPLDLAAAADLRGRFDCTLSYTVLEHVPPDEVPALLDAASRSLRPGGVGVHFVDLEDHRSNLENPFAFLAPGADGEAPAALHRGNRMRFSWWRRLAAEQAFVRWSFPYRAVRHDAPLPASIAPEIEHEGEDDLRTAAFVMVGERIR